MYDFLYLYLDQDDTSRFIIVAGEVDDLEAFAAQLNARVADGEEITSVEVTCAVNYAETVELRQPLTEARLEPLGPPVAVTGTATLTADGTLALRP
jgi:hypothetical protein